MTRFLSDILEFSCFFISGWLSHKAYMQRMDAEAHRVRRQEGIDFAGQSSTK